MRSNYRAESATHGRLLHWLGSDAELSALRSGIGGADKRVVFALVYTAVVLALIEYFFSFAAIRRHGWLHGDDPGGQSLGAGLIWVASLLVFFVWVQMDWPVDCVAGPFL